jgi:hypothetical protein
MSYVTNSEVKQYLGISVSTDDSLIDSFIDRAQGVIESYTGREFEATTATKYFDTDNIEGRWLYLWGYDLLSVTTLTNGDGTELTSEQYRLEPRNETPKYAIRLNEDYTWEFDDSDDEVSILGSWGWSTNPPNDIIQACIRLAAFLYRQKDTSADIDRPLVTGDGVTTMPSAIPQDVKSILDNYRRRVQ